MSAIICCNKTRNDKYTSAKSVGQFSLGASLIADDIKDMYDILKDGEDSVDYFWVLVGVIAASLLLQLLIVIFSLVLFCKKYPGRKKHKFDAENQEKPRRPPMGHLQRMNDTIAIFTIIVAMFHAVKNTMKGSDKSIFASLF